MKKLIVSVLLIASTVSYSQDVEYNILYCKDYDASYWRYIVFDNVYDADKITEILVNKLQEEGFKIMSYNNKTHYISSEKVLGLNINFTFCVYDSKFDPLLSQTQNTIGFCAHIYSYVINELPVDIKVYARNQIPQFCEKLIQFIQIYRK